jgi:hypothetical protein
VASGIARLSRASGPREPPTFSAVSTASAFVGSSLELAVDAFPAAANLSPSSARAYRRALDQLAREPRRPRLPGGLVHLY